MALTTPPLSILDLTFVKKKTVSVSLNCLVLKSNSLGHNLKGLLLRWLVDCLPYSTNRYYTNGFITTQSWKIPGFKVSVIVAVFHSLGKHPVLTDLLMLPLIGPDKQSLNGFSNIVSSQHTSFGTQY